MSSKKNAFGDAWRLISAWLVVAVVLGSFACRDLSESGTNADAKADASEVNPPDADRRRDSDGRASDTSSQNIRAGGSEADSDTDRGTSDTDGVDESQPDGTVPTTDGTNTEDSTDGIAIQTWVSSLEFKSVSAGRTHSCGVTTKDTLACWGAEDFGKADAPAGSYLSVSPGSAHSCGVRTDNQLRCWGHPPLVDGAPSGAFAEVSAGHTHSCALKTNGKLACWGSDSSPVLQAGWPDDQSFSGVSVSSVWTCGLRPDGIARCWGNLEDGRSQAPEKQFEGVDVGVFAGCGIQPGGAVSCWGRDSLSRSGVVPDGQFVDVSVGQNHACALREDRRVVCWGENKSGQAEEPSDKFTDISAGVDYTCGVMENNRVKCWGDNEEGRASPP